MPPIPAVISAIPETPVRREFAPPPQFVTPQPQQVAEAAPVTQASTAASDVSQWSAKRFVAQDSQQRPEAPIQGAAVVAQQSREALQPAEPEVNSVPRTQPFQRSGVVKLQSLSSTQANKKFMTASREGAEVMAAAPKKKKNWGLPFLGLFVICGLSVGGYFVMTAHQMGADSETQSEERLVSDERSQ